MSHVNMNWIAECDLERTLIRYCIIHLAYRADRAPLSKWHWLNQPQKKKTQNKNKKTKKKEE